MKPFIMVSFFLLVAFNSCQKDFGDLGSKVQPESEKIIINTDTIICKAYTLTDDSVITSNRSVNLLGSYFDPVFGTSTAGILTQIRLSQENTVFGDHDSIFTDSLVLHLYYSGYYINNDSSSIDQYINIYELNKIIDAEDTSYYPGFNPEEYYSESDIIQRSLLPPVDSTNTFNIMLPIEMANQFLFAETTDLESTESFIEFFNGFYLKPEPVSFQGAIYNVLLGSTATNLTLHYRHLTGTDTTGADMIDTLTYNFFIDQTVNKINVFEHDYSNSTIVGIDDESVENSKIYLQAMGGLRAKIIIPGLDSLSELYKSDTIIINKAELIFPRNTEGESDLVNYPPNEELLLSAIDVENGSIQEIIYYWQFFSNGTYQYVGEQFNSETNAYSFNITSYMQDYIMGNAEETLGFYLYPANSAITANRVVLNSGNNTNPIKLKIIYSKFY